MINKIEAAKEKIKIFEEVYAVIDPTNLTNYFKIKIKDDITKKANIRKIVTTYHIQEDETILIPITQICKYQHYERRQ